VAAYSISAKTCTPHSPYCGQPSCYCQHQTSWGISLQQFNKCRTQSL